MTCSSQSLKSSQRMMMSSTMQQPDEDALSALHTLRATYNNSQTTPQNSWQTDLNTTLNVITANSDLAHNSNSDTISDSAHNHYISDPSTDIVVVDHCVLSLAARSVLLCMFRWALRRVRVLSVGGIVEQKKRKHIDSNDDGLASHARKRQHGELGLRHHRNVVESPPLLMMRAVMDKMEEASSRGDYDSCAHLANALESFVGCIDAHQPNLAALLVHRLPQITRGIFSLSSSASSSSSSSQEVACVEVVRLLSAMDARRCTPSLTWTTPLVTLVVQACVANRWVYALEECLRWLWLQPALSQLVETDAGAAVRLLNTLLSPITWSSSREDGFNHDVARLAVSVSLRAAAELLTVTRVAHGTSTQPSWLPTFRLWCKAAHQLHCDRSSTPPSAVASLFVKTLSDDDQALMMGMSDMVTIHRGLTALQPLHGDSEEFPPLLTEHLNPARVFRACRVVVLADDDEVLFDMLMDNDQSNAVEYLLVLSRAVAQSNLHSHDCAFLTRLADRIERAVANDLFPFNATALVRRLRQIVAS